MVKHPGDAEATGLAPAPSPAGSPSSGEYPEELECDVTSPSGSAMSMRPIRADDAERLVVFHSLLSADSIYRRYFSVHPQLSPQEVRHLTQLDYRDRLALVVLDGDDIVAIGRYERLPSTTVGEVAFIVRDDHQHLGLGRLLLDKLALAAWSRGLTRFNAVALIENRAMIAVFEHAGFPVTTSYRDEEYSVSLDIDPDHRAPAGATTRHEGGE